MPHPHLQAPLLEHRQVHVWTISLRADGAALHDLDALLADDERSRADRFQFPNLRDRFVVGRATLRRVLAAYAGTDSSTLRFGYGPQGKPHLLDGAGLHFNLAHADETCMIAIALQCEVGIDIEATTRDPDVAGVARQAFSPVECEALAAQPAHERRDAFFRLWIRKEAYVKALGNGFAYPTTSFAVSLQPGSDDALLFDDEAPRASATWRVTEIPAPAGFCAALAAAGRDWAVVQIAASAAIDSETACDLQSN